MALEIKLPEHDARQQELLALLDKIYLNEKNLHHFTKKLEKFLALNNPYAMFKNYLGSILVVKSKCQDLEKALEKCLVGKSLFPISVEEVAAIVHYCLAQADELLRSINVDRTFPGYDPIKREPWRFVLENKLNSVLRGQLLVGHSGKEIKELGSKSQDDWRKETALGLRALASKLVGERRTAAIRRLDSFIKTYLRNDNSSSRKQLIIKRLLKVAKLANHLSSFEKKMHQDLENNEELIKKILDGLETLDNFFAPLERQAMEVKSWLSPANAKKLSNLIRKSKRVCYLTIEHFQNVGIHKWEEVKRISNSLKSIYDKDIVAYIDELKLEIFAETEAYLKELEKLEVSQETFVKHVKAEITSAHTLPEI